MTPKDNWPATLEGSGNPPSISHSKPCKLEGEIFTDLFNKIHRTWYFSDDLAQTIFITKPKKPKAFECSEFRTISLMSHVMTTLLKIILDRNEKKLEAKISENQTWFWPGKDTRKGLFNLRIIIQRYMEVQNIVFICFIYYEIHIRSCIPWQNNAVPRPPCRYEL